MSAETFYVVRKEDGERLVYSRDHTSMDLYGHISEEPVYEFVSVEPTDGAWRFATRKEAEEVAEEYVGTVQRVTVMTEDVGLRWVDDHLACSGPCRHSKLVDGSDFVATANTDRHGDKWYCMDWSGGQTDGPFDTIEEAQAAAVEAVKATWP